MGRSSSNKVLVHNKREVNLNPGESSRYNFGDLQIITSNIPLDFGKIFKENKFNQTKGVSGKKSKNNAKIQNHALKGIYIQKN